MRQNPFTVLLSGVLLIAALLSPRGLFSRGLVEDSPKPVLRRLLAPLAIMVVFLLTGAGILLWWQHDAAMDRRVAMVNSSIVAELQVDLRNQAGIFVMALESIAADPRVQQGLHDRDRERLLADWQPVFEHFRQNYALTHFNFIAADRSLLLRMHAPQGPEEWIDRFILQEAERTGRNAAGLEIGKVGTLTLRTVQPVFQNGQLLGYVELGKEIDDILYERHLQSGSHLVVTVFKKYLGPHQWELAVAAMETEPLRGRLADSAIVYTSHARLPDAFIAAADHVSDQGHFEAESHTEVASGGRRWKLSATPLKDAADKEIGCILVITDISVDLLPLTRTLALGGLSGGVVLTALLSLILVLLRRTDAGIRRQQAELRRSEERLSATLESIGDGVISTDNRGRVVHLNGVAEELTGWDSLEAFGRPIQEVFEIVHCRTRVVVENPVEQCLLEGCSVALANHTLLIHREGSERHIADSCAPIRDVGGSVIGAVLVFRDVTEAYQHRQELQRSEEQYRQLFDNSVSAVAVHELILDQAGSAVDYVFLSVNPAFEHYTGLKGAGILGRPVSEVFPENDRTLIETYGQVVQSGTPVSFEYHATFLDKYFFVHAYPLSHKRFATAFTDITQRKRSEERLESIFRIAPTGIGVVRDRVMQEINPRICEMTGYSEEELIGKNSRMLYPTQWAYEAVGKEKYDQIKVSGTGVVETLWQRKDGRIIDVLLASTPLCLSDLSQGVTFTALDITERKTAEKALRESERRLASWMGNLPGMAYRCNNDPAWTMEFVSEGCRSLTGYSPEELQRDYFRIIHPEDREQVWETVQAALSANKPFQVEYRIRTRSGDQRWVWEQGLGVFSEKGEVTAVEGILVDITDRKGTEQALTESEARYRSLFENNHAVMLVVDPSNGDVVDANPAAVSWYGWSREDLCSKNIREINMLSQKELQAAIRRARIQQDWRFQFQHRRADGTRRDVEVFSGPVKVGERSLLYSIVHDITEKKKIEQALEKRMLALTRPLDDATKTTFEELFNLGDIQRLQDDFAQATGVASMIVCPDGTPITESSNFCRLCRVVRNTEKGRANCARSDIFIGRPSSEGPTISRCLSAGLWDAGAAILVGGHHIASWLVGQVRDIYQTEDHIRGYARKIEVDEEAMVEAFQEIPAMSRKQFQRVAQAVHTLANQLSLSAYQNMQQARFIMEQKLNQEKIAFLAHHDQLTGLANRALLTERFGQAAGHARRTQTRMALCVLDLDGFKTINDTHGHALGDQLLCEVANRLQRAVRSSDTVCRIGGDEFVILFTDLQETAAITTLLQKTLLCFESRFKLEGARHTVSASMGVAVFPEDGSDFTTLFEHADASMYFAKESGRNNVQFFRQEIHQRIQQRLTIDKELRQALLEDQLVLHYQPIIKLPEKRLVGMEALVRWQHPQKGLLSPGQFIPAAEESDLIVALGQWVLNAACRDMALWRSLGLETLPVSVNVSARQLFESDFAAFVEQTLAKWGLPPQQLELEVTESIFLESSTAVELVMNCLKNIGVGLILDDFGTGYSSLSYLKRFRIEKLKIDRSFMEHVCDNQQDAVLVATIIDMARNLGVQVVSEGVETASQVQFLIDHGCELAQGFFFSKPLPIDLMQKLLERSEGGSVTVPCDAP